VGSQDPLKKGRSLPDPGTLTRSLSQLALCSPGLDPPSAQDLFQPLLGKPAFRKRRLILYTGMSSRNALIIMSAFFLAAASSGVRFGVISADSSGFS